MAYVDVFDSPVTAGEIHRYLEGVAASAAEVSASLATGRLVPQRLSHTQGYFTLPGREAIVATRQEREAASRHMWPVAIHYGRQIAALPFVRMVAVTGSLAVNNADPGADIDYLIVTENGRLWLCRAFTILIVRSAAQRGVQLCPNYFLSERALTFSQRNLYTAHEVAQMAPLAGLDVYQRLRQANRWTIDLLPNAGNPPPAAMAFAPDTTPAQGRRLAEALLRLPPGALLEQWEMRRKIRKFNRQRAKAAASGLSAEVAFSADWCKGHFDGHGQKVLATFARRIEKLDIEG